MLAGTKQSLQLEDSSLSPSERTPDQLMALLRAHVLPDGNAASHHEELRVTPGSFVLSGSLALNAKHTWGDEFITVGLVCERQVVVAEVDRLRPESQDAATAFDDGGGRRVGFLAILMQRLVAASSPRANRSPLPETTAGEVSLMIGK